MKLLKTEITPNINSHISFLKRKESFFKAPFHSHPELELVYILESHGKRIIGEKIETFKAGDMVFIGSNLPHIWLNDEIFYKGYSKLSAKAIVLYFNKMVLGNTFYNLKETAGISNFFKKAERGLRVEGKTREIVAKKLEKYVSVKGFGKIIGLFEILHTLSESKEISFINNDAYFPEPRTSENDRLSEVYKYVQDHYMDEISLSDISGLANLTPQSFCRLFKKRTDKQFVVYLNEIRISKACNFLLHTDWSISEIAYHCGYKTVSNFNKLFKELTGLTPKAYRIKWELGGKKPWKKEGKDDLEFMVNIQS